VLLDKAEAEVDFAEEKCPAWMFPNAGENGYYRSSLGDADWDRLTRRRALPLSPVEQIGLVTSTWSSAQGGAAPMARVVTALRAETGTTSRNVLEAITPVFESLNWRLVTPESRAGFTNLVREVLRPSWKALGWNPADPAKAKCPSCEEQNAISRALVAETLVALGEDDALAKEARKKADAYLDGAGGVGSEDGHLALRIAARRGDASLFDRIERLATTSDSAPERINALRALGSFSDPALLRRALDLSLSDKVKLQDGLYIFRYAFRQPASDAVGFAWLRDRFDALKAKMPAVMLGRFVSFLGGACTAADQRERSAFLTPRMDGVEGTQRDMANALERSNICVAQRGALSEGLRDALAKKQR
jgi:hypothetical protein